MEINLNALPDQGENPQGGGALSNLPDDPDRNLASVANIAPDNAAHALRNGPVAGVPPSLAMHDPQFVNAQAQAQQRKAQIQANPALAQWSAGDPVKVAATQDDYSSLGAIARTFGKNLLSPITTSADQVWTDFQREYKRTKATGTPTPILESGKQLLDIGQLILSPLASIPNAAFVQPGSTLISQIPGQMGGGPTLSNLQAPFVPLTKEEAKARWEKSLAFASMAVAPGKMRGLGLGAEGGAHAPVQPGPGPEPFNGRFGVNDAGDVLHPSGEPMVFADQKAAARWILDEGHAKSVDQIFDISNGSKEGTFGVRQTGLAADPSTPTGMDPNLDAVRETVAKEDMANVKLLTEQITESKTFQRSPEVMRDFLDQQNPNAVVYVDPHQLAKVYKTNGWVPEDPKSPFANVPGFTEEWNRGLVTGQDVPVKLSDYLTATAGHSAQDAVLEATRFREGGASVHELGTTGTTGSATGEFAAQPPKPPIDLTVPEARTILPPEGAAEPEVQRVASIDKMVRDAVEASKSRFLAQLFTDPKALGMSKEQFQLYSTKVQSAFNSMHEKLYAKVQSRVVREASQEFTDALTEHLPAATATVRGDRGMHAAIALRYPRAEDNPLGGIKLSPSVREAWGETAKNFPKEYFGEDGFDEDAAAELLGFDSGQELMNALKLVEDSRGSTPFKEFLTNVAKAEARVRALEEVGDTMAPDLIQRDIESMFAAPEIGELLTDELKILAQRVGLPLDMAQLEAAAKGQYSTLKVNPARNLQEIQRGLMKSARRAEVALLKGDTLAAFRAKQDQLVAHHMLHEAFAFSKLYDHTIRQWRRWAKKPSIANIPQEYLNYVHAQLMDMGFNVRRNPAELMAQLAGRTLSEFVADKMAEGAEIYQDELFAKEVKEHTVGEFTGTQKTLESLIHNGREENEIEVLGKRMAMDMLMGEIKSNFDALGRKLTPRKIEGRGRSLAGQAASAGGKILRGANAPNIRMEQLLDEADRNDPRGPLNRAVMDPLQASKAWENDKFRELVKEFEKLTKAQPKDWFKSVAKRIVVDGLPDTNGVEARIQVKSELLMAALNSGTESNLAKLLEGYDWDEVALQAAFDQHMTAADWNFVRTIWSLYAKLWPDVVRVYKNVAGVAPVKVEGRTISTPAGDVVGEYFPIVYDPLRAPDTRIRSASSIFGEEYHSALPANPYTKNRTNYVAPISLTFDSLTARLAGTVHDLAFRESLLQAQKVLLNPTVKKGLQENFGPEYSTQLKPWLDYIARERVFDEKSMQWYANLMKGLRVNMTAVGLMYRASAAKIHFGVAALDSLGEVGKLEFGGAMKDMYFTSPKQFEYWRDFITTQSGEVRNRILNMDRDVREAVLRTTKSQGFLYQYQKYGYHMLAMSDQVTALPTWLAAYRESIKGGYSPTEATLIADKRLRQAHGASSAVDIPAILRDGPGFWGAVGRTSMMFMSFMNHSWNRTWRMGRGMRSGADKMAEGDWAGASRDFSKVASMALFYIFASAAWVSYIRSEQRAQKFGWGTYISGVEHQTVGGLPGFHQVLDFLEHDSGASPYDRILTSTKDTAKNAWFLAHGDEHKVSHRWLQHSLETTGYFTGLGTGQLGTSSQYLWDFSTGRERPHDVMEFLRGLQYGPKPKKGKHK